MRQMTVSFEAAKKSGAICACFCAWRDLTNATAILIAAEYIYDEWERGSIKLLVYDADVNKHDSWEV